MRVSVSSLLRQLGVTLGAVTAGNRGCPGDIVAVVASYGTSRIREVICIQVAARNIVGCIGLVTVGTGPVVIDFRNRGDVIAELRLRLEVDVHEGDILGAIDMDRLIGNGDRVVTEVGVTGVVTAHAAAIVCVVPVGGGVEVTGAAVDSRSNRCITMRITRLGRREGLDTAVGQVVDGLGMDADRMHTVGTGARSVVMTVVTGITVITDPAGGPVGGQGCSTGVAVLVTAVVVTVAGAVVTESHIRSVVHVVDSGVAVAVRAGEVVRPCGRVIGSSVGVGARLRAVVDTMLTGRAVVATDVSTAVAAVTGQACRGPVVGTEAVTDVGTGVIPSRGRLGRRRDVGAVEIDVGCNTGRTTINVLGVGTVTEGTGMRVTLGTSTREDGQTVGQVSLVGIRGRLIGAVEGTANSSYSIQDLVGTVTVVTDQGSGLGSLVAGLDPVIGTCGMTVIGTGIISAIPIAQYSAVERRTIAHRTMTGVTAVIRTMTLSTVIYIVGIRINNME